MAGAGAGAGARGGAAAGSRPGLATAARTARIRATLGRRRGPRPASGRCVRGLGLRGQRPDHRALFVALGAGVTALSHPAALREAAHIQVWGPGVPRGDRG